MALWNYSVVSFNDFFLCNFLLIASWHTGWSEQCTLHLPFITERDSENAMPECFIGLRKRFSCQWLEVLYTIAFVMTLYPITSHVFDKAVWKTEHFRCTCDKRGSQPRPDANSVLRHNGYRYRGFFLSPGCVLSVVVAVKNAEVSTDWRPTLLTVNCCRW